MGAVQNPLFFLGFSKAVSSHFDTFDSLFQECEARNTTTAIFERMSRV